MLGLLYKIFPKSFNALVAGQRDRSFGSIEMTYSFTTLDGEMYYTFGHAKDMHVSRYHKLNEYMRMLGHQVTDDELAEMNTAALKALDSVDEKTGLMRPKISILGMIHHEIASRKEKILNYQIIYGIIALLNLSSDEIENGGVFDKVLQDKKVDKFMKDNEEHPLSGFFLRSGLTIYLPFIKKLEKELKESTESTMITLLAHSKAHIDAFRETLRNEVEKSGLSTGDEALKNTESTLKMN